MKKILNHFCLLLSCWACSTVAEQESHTGSYYIETIQLPEGLEGETGAIDFLDDGRLVACFLRGEVMIHDPEQGTWELFASGLHQPLGLLVISASEILVMQRPELTRLIDVDGDGRAEIFETVTGDFGMTGNYHEWNYGPARDKQGNMFIGLNTASEWGIVMDEVRGKLDTTLVPGNPMQKFSAVPYRGWIMKITSTGALMPYAYGLRSPNGLVIDEQDRLFVTDNQGDWVGTSKLYHIEEGKFYGHPASLLWTEGWDHGDPSKIPVDQLDGMRTEGVVLFPHGIMAASPTQPVIDNTGGKFGPFSGQFLIGEMNQERIIRVMLEEVDGQLQGACIPFYDEKGLKKGSNRLAFAPDGSLWIGHTAYGFIGDKGIQRMVFTGKLPMDVYSMNITTSGFDLTFTKKLNNLTASNPETYKLRHYYYDYHLEYGSDQHDIQNVMVTEVKISPDGKKVSLKLDELKAGYVYELSMNNIQSENGAPLANSLICYTVNRLKR